MAWDGKHYVYICIYTYIHTYIYTYRDAVKDFMAWNGKDSKTGETFSSGLAVAFRLRYAKTRELQRAGMHVCMCTCVCIYVCGLAVAFRLRYAKHESCSVQVCTCVCVYVRMYICVWTSRCV